MHNISFFVFQSCSNFSDEDEPDLSFIHVTTKPTKLSYKIGESLDTTGMVVTAYYSDFSKQIVTNFVTISGFDSSKEDFMQIIKVTYNENNVSKSDLFFISIEKTVIPVEYDITYTNVTTWLDFIGNTSVQAIAEITNSGTTTIFDDLKPGASMGFEAFSLSLPESITIESIAEYKVYAYPHQLNR